MKIVLAEYLQSLKERGELDVLIPELLSAMNMSVVTRPSRGTRQSGVDVFAVGKVEETEDEKVYLFSIKPGNLTRIDWDGNSEQALRPSLNEILDSFIPNRIPTEHQKKDIVIVVALGGRILEATLESITGFMGQKTTGKISFKTWNCDDLSDYILKYLFNEKIMTEKIQSLFSKALAMVETPQVSLRYGELLLKQIIDVKSDNPRKVLVSLRQVYLCVCVLHGWAKDRDNLEAAYLVSELCLLRSWKIVKDQFQSNSAIQELFNELILKHVSITTEFLLVHVLPYVGVKYGLSFAVGSTNPLDINLKLFDLLGRIATEGLVCIWFSEQMNEEERAPLLVYIESLKNSIALMINNNPVLSTPIKDDQAIDVFLACMFMTCNNECTEYIVKWLTGIFDLASLSLSTNRQYPCVFGQYQELLHHPKREEGYKEEATIASVLYPALIYWLNALGKIEVCERILAFLKDNLSHCTLQWWYPDEETEEALYLNSASHGRAILFENDGKLASIVGAIEQENENSEFLSSLSAMVNGMVPIIILACRRYRLPVPLQLVEVFKSSEVKMAGDDNT